MATSVDERIIYDARPFEMKLKRMVRLLRYRSNASRYQIPTFKKMKNIKYVNIEKGFQGAKSV